MAQKKVPGTKVTKKTAAKAAKEPAAKGVKKAAAKTPKGSKKAVVKIAKRADGGQPLWSSDGGWARKWPSARLLERPPLPRSVPSSRFGQFEAAAYGGPAPSDPTEALKKLGERVDLANEGGLPKRKLDTALAVAWAAVICAALSWEPVELRDDEGRMRRDVVVSPNRSYFVDPYRVMRRALRLDRGSRGDNTVVLLFNMIRDGSRLPPSKRGAYLELS